MTEKDIAALKREVKFNADGLVPAVAQSAETGVVLMQAYMNEEALEKTLETGYAHYYSRSRKCLWQKGESLPQPLEEMLKELKDVDERLNLIRAQRFAKLEEKKQQNAEPSPEGASEDEAVTEETAEENVKEAPSAAETEDESAAPLEEGETGDNA